MKVLITLYGVAAYAIGTGGLAYLVLALGAFEFLPVHINSKEPGSVATALLINTGLMVLFGIQHTVTARSRFKAGLVRFIPAAAERSTYVLLSGVFMLIFAFYWQALPGELWRVDSGSLLFYVLFTGYVVGWIIAVLATFLINHFELFGLQQVYLNLKGKPEPNVSFTERGFYKIVRHPLQLGVLLGIWCTPHMTMTHLMFATTLTIYIFVGLYFEEKDLAASLGPDYEDYQRRVRKILPFPVSKKGDKPLAI